MAIEVRQIPGSTLQTGPPDALLPPPLGIVTVPDITSDYLKAAGTGSPAWWLNRLSARLDARAPELILWDAYYRGRQPLAFASERFREAFGGRFRAFSSNFCSLVVDGTRERMRVTGFQMPSKRASDKAWRIWQENDLDAFSQIAHTEALIKGVAYTLVEPRRGQLPRVTIEDPLDAITESDPRDRRTRRAGLKRWVDDDGHLVVFLYLPDFIWKLRTSAVWRESTSTSFKLVPAPGDGEPWPLPNPLGVVPLVPLVNRPRLGDDGQSEVAPVMSNQDAVNKYRADALVAAEFGAFRQRWAIGLDIPVDPKTGKAIEPFKAAVDRVWTLPRPDPEDPNQSLGSFGEFSQTDLAPYQSMIESEVGAISSISRLPYHYLLGQPQSVPPSGESLKSSEAGLIAKVGTQMVHFGEGWEETARLTLLAVGDAGASDRTSQTNWADPETRNEGVRTDAVVKAKQASIITRRESRVALGFSPEPAADDPDEQPAPEPPPPPAGDDAGASTEGATLTADGGDQTASA